MNARFDFLQFLRFGLVGGAATVVHLGVVVGVEARLSLPLVIVHGFGYLCAFSLSFAGHYVFTFSSTQKWQRALMRFLIVSLIALLASTILAVLGAAAGLPRLANLLFAATSVPVLAYIANREFVF